MFTLAKSQDDTTVLGAGTYDWAGTAPFQPQQYSFRPYVLPSTYGKSEAEETAARLITIYQRHGAWATIDYNALRRMVGEEMQSGALFGSGVFSLIPLEVQRGRTLEQAVARIFGIGLHYLEERGYILLHLEGSRSLIEPFDSFFEPIERHVTTSV